MKELSLNILDIVGNSVSANASTVMICVWYKISENKLLISIDDDGCGMSKEFLEKVTSPYATTRTTRKVGLGIPFIKDSAEAAGGTFNIDSKVGVGTWLKMEYVLDHIDRMPMGNLSQTMTTLIGGKESVRYILKYKVEDSEFIFDTDEVRAELGSDIPLDSIEVIAFLKDYIEQGIAEAQNGFTVD